MREARCLLVALAWLLAAAGAACERQPAITARARADAAAARPPPARMGAAAGASQSTSAHTGVPAASAGPAASAAAGASLASAVADDEPLVGEEREPHPGSGTVKIKVIVAERRQAHVIWGRKDFGVAPLEIERPRDSGPLDLVVIAPGYLPYHARAFTDRDDTVMVHLYSATEAPQLLGYRASDVPAPSASAASGSTPASNQNRQKSR